MKLVENWKTCHKWFSVQLSILGIVAVALWDYVPALNSPRITMLMFALIAVGRIIDQEKKEAGRITDQGGKDADSVKAPVA